MSTKQAALYREGTGSSFVAGAGTEGGSPLRPISDEEWERMKALISDQLHRVTTPLEELRASGTLAAISQIIQRGDSCKRSRLQAWYHGMLEIEYSNRPFAVAQKLNQLYEAHLAQGPDETPQSFVLDTTITSKSSDDGDDGKRRRGSLRSFESDSSAINRLEGKPNLSVVERQQLWLAKKNVRQEALKSQKREAAAAQRANTAPDLSRSRQSFRSMSGTPAASSRRTNKELDTGFCGNKRKLPGARKGSATMSGRSLGNITNKSAAAAAETAHSRKRRKRVPITDPFNMSTR